MASFKQEEHQQEFDWVSKYKNIGQTYGIGTGNESCVKIADDELATNWDAIDVQLRRAKAKINQLLS